MSELYVVVPRIGTNDDVVTIGSWLVENGSYVQKGQPVASLETTKETEDLVAEHRTPGGETFSFFCSACEQ